jgi:hypothetical protein
VVNCTVLNYYNKVLKGGEFHGGLPWSASTELLVYGAMKGLLWSRGLRCWAARRNRSPGPFYPLV